MSNLLLGLKKVILDLSNLDVKFALVGGLAVSYHALERATKNLDFSIAVSNDSEAEEVIRKLINTGYQQHQILDHKTTGRLATACLLSSARIIIKLFAIFYFALAVLRKRLQSQQY